MSPPMIFRTPIAPETVRAMLDQKAAMFAAGDVTEDPGHDCGPSVCRCGIAATYLVHRETGHRAVACTPDGCPYVTTWHADGVNAAIAWELGETGLAANEPIHTRAPEGTNAS